MKRNERGFSALELMIAVIVVGVLSSLGTAGLARHINYSRRPEAFLGLATIARMQDAYYQTNLTYAPSIDELGFQMDQGSLTAPNSWKGRRYTFSVTAFSNGQRYVATAVGDLDGDEFQDILFVAR